MIRVYHGSNVAVESPLTGIGRKAVDFGEGFYVTAQHQPNHQICITRQEVVDRYMHFVESVQVNAYVE